MSKKPVFVKTATQEQALRLLQCGAAHILLYGGSRSGKTFILLYALVSRALRAAGSRHAILRFHGNSARYAIGCDTLPKVIALAFPGLRVDYSKTDSVVRFANRSEIWLAGLDKDERAEKILGREFATLYFNECSEIDYNSVSTALTRLAQRTALTPRAYYDCNPVGKSHWSYKLFITKLDPLNGRALPFPEDYVAMVMNPDGNRVNLPPGYLEKTLAALSERQRQRFLEGRWLDDLEGALFRERFIAAARVDHMPCAAERLVIGVDPAVSATATADHTGIVAAARGTDGDYYVLADASVRGTPLEWTCRVAALYERFQADRVVGEVNQGGDLIAAALRAVAPEISFKAVRAARGKIIRAEPVAALYEQGRVHHVGHFPELEQEMSGYTGSGASPDRMDALVWALSELLGGGGGDRAIPA